jgi:hypothetical protein
MAIQSSYAAAQGFTAPVAYSHITTFFGTKTGIRATVEVHFDKAARDAGKQPIGVEVVQLKLADGATMAQMYEALAAEPKWAGATSV